MADTRVTAAPAGRVIVRGAALSGLINGAIQLFLLPDHAPLPLTVAGITNEEHTVFGAAGPLAVSLAMILTAVAYTTVKASRPPFLPVSYG